MAKHFPAKYSEKKFHCPFCGVFSVQHWLQVIGWCNSLGQIRTDEVEFCQCEHCSNRSIWRRAKMIFPTSGTTPPPHDEMPEDLKSDFEEARSIATLSPRGAAALLRLVLQKLIVELGEKGKDINTDIGNLVKKGLSVQIQQALDSVRVIGNKAVHPGELDLNDTPELAHALFELVNVVVDVMIAQPNRIATVYSNIPPNALQGIQDRDGT